MAFLTVSVFSKAQTLGHSRHDSGILGLLLFQFKINVPQVDQRVCNGNVSVGFLQYNKHLFVHIGHANHSYSDPLLESVDIRQIYDKFPEKKGGLKELFGKGPQNAFFLVKFWVSKTWLWWWWVSSARLHPVGGCGAAQLGVTPACPWGAVLALALSCPWAQVPPSSVWCPCQRTRETGGHCGLRGPCVPGRRPHR